MFFNLMIFLLVSSDPSITVKLFVPVAAL